MKKQEKPKMYCSRKYIMAKNVTEALRKEKTTAVHEIYIDNNWQEKNLATAIGFGVEVEEE